ncbi:MAG: DUF2911 domain-containing protein [Gemmatimonadota bacterium]
MSIRTTILTALACGTIGAPAAQAQSADSGAFFVRLGKDTIAVERYVRTPLQLIGEAVLRSPQTRRYKLTVTFKADGSVSWYEVENIPVAGVPNSAPIMRSVTTYGADSARTQTWVAAAPRPMRSVAASADMIPLQLPFYSTYETMLMRARKAATDTLTASMLSASGPLPYKLSWIGRDSVTLFHPQSGAIRARVDAQGRLLGLNGEGTTFKVVVTRAPQVDLEKYIERYAAADAAGKALGALSPRDSLEAEVGTALMVLGYSQPSRRGRVVFGGIVPWAQVWRTGANAATWVHFTKDVEIEGERIPAGRYTLWTIPDPKQWQLIINKQTGQWGTDYDPSQDLVRIPVQSETLSVPVETFTIAVEPKGEEARLTLTWDRTRVLVPIREAK